MRLFEKNESLQIMDREKQYSILAKAQCLDILFLTDQYDMKSMSLKPKCFLFFFSCCCFSENKKKQTVCKGKFYPYKT